MAKRAKSRSTRSVPRWFAITSRSTAPCRWSNGRRPTVSCLRMPGGTWRRGRIDLARGDGAHRDFVAFLKIVVQPELDGSSLLHDRGDWIQPARTLPEVQTVLGLPNGTGHPGLQGPDDAPVGKEILSPSRF